MGHIKMARGVLRRVVSVAMLAALILSVSAPALAAERVDVAREGSLSLVCHDGGAALEGVEFQLYRVGDVSETARFALSGDFKDYPVNLRDLDATGWKTAANTLAAYVAADRPASLGEGKTDAKGALDFGKQGTGLYLILGGRYTRGNDTYDFAPFLTSLPGLSESDAWVYDVALTPKFTKTERPTGGGDGGEPATKKMSVIKHWEGDEGESRPTEIAVSLLKNGEVHDTVLLNDGNFWRHTWTGLSAKSDWSIIEHNVPEHYTVTYTENGAVLTVTNTYTVDIPDEPPPVGGPDEPDNPGGTDTPEEPGGEVEIPSEEVPTGTMLPQTGQLWWPVPLLAALGLAVFGLGWFDTFRRRRDSHEN